MQREAGRSHGHRAIFESIEAHSSINDDYIRTLQERADAKRTYLQRLADSLTEKLGDVTFLILNLIWFIVWIVLNIGLIPGITPFDPFPFSLLTMIVSLEAIIISIVVLMSQNRETRVSALRSEVDLHIDAKAEEELTKLLELVSLLLQKQGVDLSHDSALQEMLKPTPTEKIEETLEQQLIEKIGKQATEKQTQ